MSGQTETQTEQDLLAKAGPFGRAILAIGERWPDVVTLSADVAGVTGLGPFAQRFPDRFVNVGMAEENLISVAVGLAKAGLTPVPAERAQPMLRLPPLLEGAPAEHGR